LQVPVQHEKYLADEKIRDNVDALKYDFDRGPATLARSRRIYDASSFDLTAFKARGGKILMWHGWADGAIMATSSIGYYEGVVKAMGSRRQTEDFFRLFLVPGVHHGGGGPGFTEFDSLTALENWVEKGQAPMGRPGVYAPQRRCLSSLGSLLRKGGSKAGGQLSAP
jgi:hypothetical protein